MVCMLDMSAVFARGASCRKYSITGTSMVSVMRCFSTMSKNTSGLKPCIT